MKHSSAYTFGVLFGLVVGVIISLFVLRAINKNHSMRTEYDEMQKRVRGDAYMYGFFAIIFFEALLALTELLVKIPADPMILHFMAILIGICVQAGYSIWNDAYVGLNTSMDRFLISMVLIGGVNLLVAVFAWLDGRMVVGGILQPPFINFMVFLVFLILGLIGLLKKSSDKGEER